MRCLITTDSYDRFHDMKGPDLVSSYFFPSNNLKNISIFYTLDENTSFEACRKETIDEID